MTTTMLAVQVLFWLASIAIVFPYLVYPLVLYWLARLLRNPIQRPDAETSRPSVTLVISAFNEEEVISSKLENALALDYPKELLRIVVISDASSDSTDELVQRASKQDSRIRLCRQETRYGKTAGLNAVMPTIASDVVVFSDANAMYEPDAITELVWPFHDAQVGYVVGAALYSHSQDGAAANEGEYWDFELRQKQLESELDSVVGGDGAIYAIRRELYWELEKDDINDFVNPLQIVAQGYRGVFSRSARCYEEAADSFGKEFQRKRRIVNRSWRAVLRYAWKINPLRRPKFTFCLYAHKVIRWFGAPMMALQLACALTLAIQGHGYIYWLAACLTGMLVFLGLLGWFFDSRGVTLPRMLSLPYYFCLASTAAGLGVLDQCRGVRHTTWQHVRDHVSAAAKAEKSA